MFSGRHNAQQAPLRQLPEPAIIAKLERDSLGIWNTIPQRFLHNYINDMRSRKVAVIRGEGGHTRY